MNALYLNAASQVPMERFIDHPQYDTTTIKNDISIIVTVNEMSFSQNAYPACLPARQFCLNAGTVSC